MIKILDFGNVHSFLYDINKLQLPNVKFLKTKKKF